MKIATLAPEAEAGEITPTPSSMRATARALGVDKKDVRELGIDRTEHVAEWIRLTEEQRQQQPAQVAPPVRKHGHAQQGAGINAATRELGIDRTEAQCAVKIATSPRVW